jgi:hypothetical protein
MPRLLKLRIAKGGDVSPFPEAPDLGHAKYMVRLVIWFISNLDRSYAGQLKPGLCSILWVCLVGCIFCLDPHKILFGWLHCSLGCTVASIWDQNLTSPSLCSLHSRRRGSFVFPTVQAVQGYLHD